MTQAVTNSGVKLPADLTPKEKDKEAGLPANLATFLSGPSASSGVKLSDHAIEPLATKLERDLRALPRNILERIKNVERILGKFPSIVPVDNTEAAHYARKTKEIHVNNKLTYNEQLAFIIFELLNIERLDEFDYIDAEASQGMHTMESFGKAYEKIEFENSLTHHRLVQGLSSDFDLFEDPWDSFDECLKYQIANGHTETYYKAYKEKQFKYFFGAS